MARRARAELDDPPSHPVDPPPALRLETLRFEHTAMYGGPSSAIAGIPRDLAPGERLPLIVLLPGGHHNMQGPTTGVWGWWSEYMLGDLDTALRRGSLTERDFQGLVRPPELAAFNGWLASMPYRGAVYVTPWVVGRQLDPAPHGTMVAAFLRDVVARARAELPVLSSREATGLGGMSSGGLWALYAGALDADLFGTVVATQPFTDELVKPIHDTVVARAQPQRLKIVTSTDDHQKKTTTELSESLRRDGVEHELVEYLGAHSAAFAAGPGGLDALLTFDRALRGEAMDGTRPLPDHDGLAQLVAVGPERERPPLPVRAPHGGSVGAATLGGVAGAAALAAGAWAWARGRRERSPEVTGAAPVKVGEAAKETEIEVPIHESE
ncbi:MAG: hypothetical protein NVSMB47_16780 [Polyangiales bacterium]